MSSQRMSVAAAQARTGQPAPLRLREPGHPPRSPGQRFARQAVLIAPLVLVNAAAVYGQVQWATANLTGGSVGLAVLFALTVESIAVYLAYEAHAALLAGDASFRLRVASYLAAGLVGVLNYSHFAAPGLTPTAAALAFGGLSSISPWLWSIRSRSLRRDQLRTAGLIDARSARFAAAKWANFPIRTLRAYRWSVDHGVQEERAAWEAYRASQHRRRAGAAEPDAKPTTRTSHERRRLAHGEPATPALTRGAPNNRGNARPAPDSHDTSSSGQNEAKPARNGQPAIEHEDLRQRVQSAVEAGERVTGATVGQWLGASARTGRRRLSALLAHDPALAKAIGDTEL